MSGSEAKPPASLLKWSWRGRDKRPEGVRVVVTSMFAAGAAGAWLLGPQWMFVGPAILSFTLADYLFGRQFELTDRDARNRVFFSLSTICWTDVRRVIQKEDELLLSPLEGESWRDSFRGVQLALIPSAKDRVLEIIRERVPDSATYIQA